MLTNNILVMTSNRPFVNQEMVYTGGID